MASAAEISRWIRLVRDTMHPDGSTVTASDIKRRSGLAAGEVRRGLNYLIRTGEVTAYESKDLTECPPRRRLRYGRTKANQAPAPSVSKEGDDVA